LQSSALAQIVVLALFVALTIAAAKEFLNEQIRTA
jgi:hypothetical protein